MKTLPLIVAVACLALPSCITSAFREAHEKEALPANEIHRSPVVLTGRKVADAEYDVYRFHGWLLPKEDQSPRIFDLYLPKKRTDAGARIKEVKTSKNPLFTGDVITASFDMRYTSRMMFDDPKCLKKTDLVIGESIAEKGRLVSVGLREGGRTHHWYARMDLDWVKRDKALHRADNASYLLTVPADVAAGAGSVMLEGWSQKQQAKRNHPFRP